jgi:hypothetical protein
MKELGDGAQSLHDIVALPMPLALKHYFMAK